MRITMITTACGPNGNLEAGKTYEVSEVDGKSFVDGKFAKSAELGEQVRPVEVPKEGAVREPAKTKPVSGKANH